MYTQYTRLGKNRTYTYAKTDDVDNKFRCVSQLSLIMTLLLWMRTESNTR